MKARKPAKLRQPTKPVSVEEERKKHIQALLEKVSKIKRKDVWE